MIKDNSLVGANEDQVCLLVDKEHEDEKFIVKYEKREIKDECHKEYE